MQRGVLLPQVRQLRSIAGEQQIPQRALHAGQSGGGGGRQPGQGQPQRKQQRQRQQPAPAPPGTRQIQTAMHAITSRFTICLAGGL